MVAGVGIDWSLLGFGHNWHAFAILCLVHSLANWRRGPAPSRTKAYRRIKIRLQGELHQAVRKAYVAEDTMREHLLGRALAEPLGESQRGIAPPLPQDYKSEPYRDAKVMGAHLEAKAAPYNTEAPLEPTLKSKSTLYPLGPQAASVHVVGEESYFPPVIDGADGGKVDWASRYQIKAKLKEPAAKPSEAQ